ncbi:MAG: tetratricopeptide repeat protein [Bacteroidetes bacterium]|nr:tetratricopeptide repeat protein [Bacteroidota bacterium]
MNMRNLFLVSATALLFGACTAQKPILESNPAFDPIRKTTLNERYEKALSDVESLPSSGEKFSVVGFNYAEWAFDGKTFDTKKNQEAIDAFNAGVKIDSLFPMNYVGLGRMALRNKDIASAQRYFAKAQSIVENKKYKVSKPLKQNTYIAIAAAQLAEETRDTTAARKALNLASAIDENNLELRLTWGDYQFRKNINNQSAAIAEYNKCLNIDSKYAPALYRKARLYKAAKNYEESLKTLNEAIALDPTFAPAYREKAEMSKELSRFEEAISAYEKYLELNNSCRVQQRYASFFYLTKNYDRAITEINAAIVCNENNHILNRILGYSHFELKAYDQAKSFMDKFFAKEDPRNFDVKDFETYADIMIGLGQDSIAILNYEKALSLFPDYTAGYDKIATLYTNNAMAAKGKENEAKRIMYYTKAADTYSKKMAKLGEDPRDLFVQGQVLYFSQQYVLADSTFMKATKRYPESWFWVAKCENKLDVNQEGRAKAFYEKAIVLVGQNPEAIAKGKKSLAEAYQYLGLYYGNMGDLNCSKSAWMKVLELDPTNKLANQLLVTPETLDKELMAAAGDCVLVTFPEVKKEEEEK